MIRALAAASILINACSLANATSSCAAGCAIFGTVIGALSLAVARKR